MRQISNDERRRFSEDGVVCLPALLTSVELSRLERAFAYSQQHPGPGATRLYEGHEGAFFQDGSNLQNWPYYREVLDDIPLADVAASLWQAGSVWFMNEQIFLKDGSGGRRTPWHQDCSYTPYAGEQLAIMWINFDPVAIQDSLEFVRKSHRGPVYNGSAFDPADDTRPVSLDTTLPRLPDIQQERDRWDIISFPIAPGDVVVFHNGTLHGGGPTRNGERRRTLSLRFFGTDVVRVERGDTTRTGGNSALDDELLSGWSSLVTSLELGQQLADNPSFMRLQVQSPKP